jgi:hypothetical protein
VTNEFYRSFIETAKGLAQGKGLRWDLPCDDLGKVARADRWDLTRLSGMVPPPTLWLGGLDCYPAAVEVLSVLGKGVQAPSAMSQPWREFYQAVVINEVLIKKNKPGHALANIARYIRLLAACANESIPYELDGSQVQLAYNVALKIGDSGKHASNLAMVVRTVIDGLHLADRGPLARFCLPYPADDAKAAQARVASLKRKENTHRRTDRMRTELSQRKGASRLPDEKAFWELVRIAFTEQPRSFADAVRFAQVKTAVATGFRVGEHTTIPADWERWREYVDADGRPAGEKGGVSRSLMIRHFAEKQAADEGPEGVVLYEAAQHVPPMFEATVLDALNDAARITASMRARLRLQIETGRLLPEFAPDDLLPAWDLYTRVSGSIRFAKPPLPEDLVAEYRSGYDPVVLDAIRDLQLRELYAEGSCHTFRVYWWKLAESTGLTIRNANGDPRKGRVDWAQAWMRVGEVEAMIRGHMPTKLPDTTPFSLADGTTLYASDLLFLMPIRALAENRDGGVTDVNRYFAIGRVASSDFNLHLGAADDSLFSRYGETDEDRHHRLNSHSLRHLQNAELFRLGVADTIITKRFNRSSVAQSYEYDHRSLAEDLERIDLPPGAERMGPRAQEAFRLIRSGRAGGSIVEEFLRIQREQGDDAAFDYLDAEADGLHVTPYGFCLNSFTVDPCPKHLECFDGCRHLTRTTLPEEQHNLLRLRDRTTRAIAKLEATPVAARNVGWRNQLAHGRKRLAGIEAALAARPGEAPFPDGPDLFRSAEDKAGTTILDAKPKLRRAE